MRSTVGVVIPALDEEESIAKLVLEIPRDVAETIIVVDNGSGDATAARAREAGATVISEPRRGYGRAVAAGIRALPPEVRIVVFLDGDGSDDPAFIGSLIAPIEKGKADFVLGSRTRGPREDGSLSGLQIAAGRFAGWCLRVQYGVRFSDMSPYRAVRRALLDAMPMTELTYGWNLQMMIIAARQRLSIVEIPVRTRRRSGGVSKVSGNPRVAVIAGTRILRVLASNTAPARAPTIQHATEDLP